MLWPSVPAQNPPASVENVLGHCKTSPSDIRMLSRIIYLHVIFDSSRLTPASGFMVRMFQVIKSWLFSFPFHATQHFCQAAESCLVTDVHGRDQLAAVLAQSERLHKCNSNNLLLTCPTLNSVCAFFTKRSDGNYTIDATSTSTV
jgi:hypothetical protein